MTTPSRTVPGFVNAHTHIYSALAPYGMPPATPPPENFVQILERVWWRLDRALDERALRASARLYAAESLLFGTTKSSGALMLITPSASEIMWRVL